MFFCFLEWYVYKVKVKLICDKKMFSLLYLIEEEKVRINSLLLKFFFCESFLVDIIKDFSYLNFGECLKNKRVLCFLLILLYLSFEEL